MRSMHLRLVLSIAAFMFVPAASAQRVPDGPVCSPNDQSPTAPARRVGPAVRPVAPTAPRPAVRPFAALREEPQPPTENRTGDSVGDAFGYGGLGATGTSGWGGGNTGEGTIGMGDIGTMGHGSGQGYSSGAGRGLRGRGTTGPTIRATNLFAGGVSPEAIRAVVLRNLGQVNRCYEIALGRNMALHGRLTVRFVISGNGSVSDARVASSDETVNEQALHACINGRIRAWQFAAPEGGGVVTVNYPFNLEPPAPPTARPAAPPRRRVTPPRATPPRPATPAPGPSFTPASPATFSSQHSMA